MTRIFDENKRHVPVSVLKVDNVRVVGVMTKEKNGYTAVQLAAGTAKEKRVSKPVLGHLKKAGSGAAKAIKEFRVSQDCLLNVGDEILPSHFVAGQFVDISGLTIGKGFAGGMKRWNFRGLEASHGVSITHRSIGSTGQRQEPGKVFKGKKMPGHLGVENITIQNLVIVEANDADGYILVKGAVPGFDGAMVCIYDAIKKPLHKDLPMPASLKKAATSAAPASEAETAPVAEAPAAEAQVEAPATQEEVKE